MKQDLFVHSKANPIITSEHVPFEVDTPRRLRLGQTCTCPSTKLTMVNQ